MGIASGSAVLQPEAHEGAHLQMARRSMPPTWRARTSCCPVDGISPGCAWRRLHREEKKERMGSDLQRTTRSGWAVFPRAQRRGGRGDRQDSGPSECFERKAPTSAKWTRHSGRTRARGFSTPSAAGCRESRSSSSGSTGNEAGADAEGCSDLRRREECQECEEVKGQVHREQPSSHNCQEGSHGVSGRRSFQEKKEAEKEGKVTEQKEETPEEVFVDYKEFEQWLQQQRSGQTATSTPEEGHAQAGIGPEVLGGAFDGSAGPSSSGGGRQLSRSLGGVHNKGHDVLSNTSTPSDRHQDPRCPGTRNPRKRDRHASRRKSRRAWGPSERKVHSNRECFPDWILGKRTVVGGGTKQSARSCPNSLVAGGSTSQPDRRQSRWQGKLVAPEGRRLLEQLWPRKHRRSASQGQGQDTKRKRKRKEGQEECMEREASRGESRRGQLEASSAECPCPEVAIAADLEEAASGEALTDPYMCFVSDEEWVEECAGSSDETLVSLGALNSTVEETSVFEREPPTMADPYLIPLLVGNAEDDACRAGISVNAERLAAEERTGQCLSWSGLGKLLCKGMVSGEMPRGFEFFSKQFAPWGASEASGESLRNRRWKLFPLPVDFKSCLASEEERVPSVPGAKSLTALTCMGLNWLAGEKRNGPRARASAQVCRVVENIEKRIERFLKEEDDEIFDPTSLWSDLISKRIGYDGEEVAEPVPLSFEQILLSVPPVGHGGAVPVIPFLTGKTRRQLERPEECILAEELQIKGPNKAAVHIVRGHERKVWKLLEERGVIEWFPLKDIYKNADGPFLSGLFGVPKSGRFDEQGRQVLRVIMNLKPINRILQTIQGDIGALPSAPDWCQLHLSADETLRLSQGDMAAAFYLFKLPPCWRPYFGFNCIFNATSVGASFGGKAVPVCRVLPMGWTSSVGVMQMLSRNLLLNSRLPGAELRKDALAPPWFVEEALRVGGECWWQVYLDNFMSAEVCKKAVEPGPGKQLHSQAMAVWDQEGVLNVPEKHVIDAPLGIELGVRLGGEGRLIGASATRVRKLVHVTLQLLQRPYPRRRWVQVVLGRWIFVLQFRRQGMCILNQCWNYLKPGEDKRRWWPLVQKELAALVLIAPLLQWDSTCEYSPLVSCSDASESGGAIAVAEGLSKAGKDFGSRLRDVSTNPIEIPVLVISLFNGIGGAFRGYDVAGLVPLGLIAVECDAAARRVCRRAWPRAIEIDDVRKIDRSMVQGWCNRFPRVLEVHLHAGFPCVHLSSARADRLNLEGEGSNFFWELIRVLAIVEEEFSPTAQVEFVVENVASMDVAAREEISNHLGVEPIWVCPSDLMPFNRPRLAWVSAELQPCAGVTYEQGPGFVRVWMDGTPLEDEQWIETGWRRCDPSNKLPTFMKAIRRRAPPAKPAGLSRCEPQALDRWRSDDFRFPPYQYRRHFLLEDEYHNVRYPGPRERELLLGFGHQHVAFALPAGKAKDDPSSFEDKQLSLLGDSFAMLSFSWITSQLGRKWASPTSPNEILARLGLAPGAGLAPHMQAPIRRELNYGCQSLPPPSGSSVVAQLARHVNHTGSDVSLSLGVALSGKATAHASLQAGWWIWRILFTSRWKFKSHINYLEMKVILQTILWRSRFASSLNSRWLHLADSMVCNFILSKGRTSSLLLQPLVREANSVLLALNAVQYQAHVDSGENPTDAASRSAEVGPEG